jgi:hypothetical protein
LLERLHDVNTVKAVERKVIPVNQIKEKKVPTAEDFSAGAVKRAVFKEAIQHPTTLYPAALSLLGAAYMLLVNLSPKSLGVAVISGLASVVSMIYHYFIRGESIAENYIKDLKERRDFHKEQEAGNIEEECRAAGFPEGEKEARELKTAYNQLYSFLRGKLEQQRKVMTAQRFLIMADETYLQGLQLLRKALLTFNVLKQIDVRKLEEEKRTFEKELSLEEKKGDPSRAPIIEAFRAKLQSHEKRLKLYVERKGNLEQLMAQCEILEAALDTTYLEVVDIISDDASMERSSAAENLERAVAAARRVEEQLRKTGTHTLESDEIYNTNAK